MDTQLRIGLVALARPTFDVPLAAAVFAQARASLQAAGLAVVGPAELVLDAEAAEAAAMAFASKPPDALVLLQASFADSSMAQQLAQTGLPLLLWAVPETRSGGRLRLNSLCGINLAGHALTRAGVRYSYAYAAPDDPAVAEQATALARAGRACRVLRGAQIGRVGMHPAGFESCTYDAPSLAERFGVQVAELELAPLFAAAQAADPAVVTALRQQLASQVDGLAELEPTALAGTLGVYLALRQASQAHTLDGLAVRCWPEFFTELGCAACGALSLLIDAYTPCSCEADLLGTVTQLALQAIGNAPAFGVDLVQIDASENSAVVWHCGHAPRSMCDPAVRPRATIHSNRRLPLLFEFPLRPGIVTLARFSQGPAGYRLVVGRGEMLAAPPSFSGTSGVLRFAAPATQVLDTMMTEGLEHHLSLIYGDYQAALLALAQHLDLPVVRLTPG